MRFLEKKLAGKPDMTSPEEDQQDSDNSVCVKELEITSLACGSNRDLLSLNEQAILCEFGW